VAQPRQLTIFNRRWANMAATCRLARIGAIQPIRGGRKRWLLRCVDDPGVRAANALPASVGELARRLLLGCEALQFFRLMATGIR
jgi:hypothetical protein